MREIRVYCTCNSHGKPIVSDVPSMLKYLHVEDIEIAKNLVWDPENPEYVFLSELIYTYKGMKQLRKYARKNAILIFFAEEAVYPDMNIFDYAIIMNRELTVSDRVARMPPSIYWKTDKSLGENTLTQEQAKLLLKEKSRFCNFIYSHRSPERDDIFHALSKYKHIDSLGSHLNNIGFLLEKGRFTNDWQDLSVQIKNKYKFSIAAENSCFEGYISEKLLTSFQAHTVPIYWGDIKVAQEYNPEAFINCNDYKNFDELIQRVKEIDENDDLWAYMVSQPWQTESQGKNSDNEYANYKKFIENIFSNPDKRCSKNGWADTYTFWLLEHDLTFLTYAINRIYRCIHHPFRIIHRFDVFKQRVTKKKTIEEFFND